MVPVQLANKLGHRNGQAQAKRLLRPEPARPRYDELIERLAARDARHRVTDEAGPVVGGVQDLSRPSEAVVSVRAAGRIMRWTGDERHEFRVPPVRGGVLEDLRQPPRLRDELID